MEGGEGLGRLGYGGGEGRVRVRVRVNLYPTGSCRFESCRFGSCRIQQVWILQDPAGFMSQYGFGWLGMDMGRGRWGRVVGYGYG